MTRYVGIFGYPRHLARRRGEKIIRIHGNVSTSFTKERGCRKSCTFVSPWARRRLPIHITTSVTDELSESHRLEHIP